MAIIKPSSAVPPNHQRWHADREARSERAHVVVACTSFFFFFFRTSWHRFACSVGALLTKFLHRRLRRKFVESALLVGHPHHTCKSTDASIAVAVLASLCLPPGGVILWPVHREQISFFSLFSQLQKKNLFFLCVVNQSMPATKFCFFFFLFSSPETQPTTHS